MHTYSLSWSACSPNATLTSAGLIFHPSADHSKCMIRHLNNEALLSCLTQYEVPPPPVSLLYVVLRPIESCPVGTSCVVTDFYNATTDKHKNIIANEMPTYSGHDRPKQKSLSCVYSLVLHVDFKNTQWNFAARALKPHQHRPDMTRTNRHKPKK